jgi:hypothetical protein
MSKLLGIVMAGFFAGGAMAHMGTEPHVHGGADHPSGKYGVNTCPPGLAKKDNGCMPPGQVGKDTARMGNGRDRDRDGMHGDVTRRDGTHRDVARRDGTRRDRDTRR